MMRFGLNTTAQNTLALVPANIVVHDYTVPTYRGKRVIEVNSRNTVLEKIDIRDVYSPIKQDNQAIAILNSPGNITVQDFWLEAASENFMVGGDTMKIPNTRPTNIIVKNGVLTKPIAWKTLMGPDGKPVAPVKNLLELKDGHDVLIEDVEAYNCWVSGQQGYCFMFTPSNGGSLRNIRVVECNVRTVSGIVNITGTDASGINKERTQVVFQGGDFTTNKDEMGGRGCFALMTRGPECLEVYDANINIDGNAIMVVGDRVTVDRLIMKRCTFNTGTKYEITIGPLHNGDNSLGIIKNLIIEDNIISGASKLFKGRFPNNIYV